MIRRLSMANSILLHQELIDQTGVSHGVRDMNLIEGANFLTLRIIEVGQLGNIIMQAK